MKFLVSTISIVLVAGSAFAQSPSAPEARGSVNQYECYIMFLDGDNHNRTSPIVSKAALSAAEARAAVYNESTVTLQSGKKPIYTGPMQGTKDIGRGDIQLVHCSAGSTLPGEPMPSALY